jgi:Cof subfamily protein (haloacid dehalogenase superfamily)
VVDFVRPSGFRVVAVDLDGTLAGADGRVTNRTMAALRKTEASGLTIVVATGRAYPAALEVWCTAGLSAPLITCGGAFIVQPPVPEVIEAHFLASAVVATSLRLGQELDLAVSLWTEDAIWMSRQGLLADQLKALNRVDVLPISAGPRAPIPSGPMPVLKVMLGGEPSQLDRVQSVVLSELAEAEVARAMPQYMDVTPPGVSKRRALETVLAGLGVNAAEAIAIGDGDNDVGMLDLAGLAVVPANAMAAARAVADLVIGRHDRDGVAQFLEAIVEGDSLAQVRRLSSFGRPDA